MTCIQLARDRAVEEAISEGKIEKGDEEARTKIRMSIPKVSVAIIISHRLLLTPNRLQ